MRQWIRCFVRLSVLLTLVTIVASVPSSAAAGDLAKLDTSLKLIPADASFYSSMLRNREQFEAIKNSNAWAKIMAMPIVKTGLGMYNAALQSPGSAPAIAHAMVNAPENRDTITLLTEMVSDEIFVYGDKSVIDSVRLFQIINTARSLGAMKGKLAADSEEKSMEQFQAGAAISALAKHADMIRVPNVVIGFRLKNTKRANEQLAKLEKVIQESLEGNEKTKDCLKKTEVAGHQSLVLTLEGSLAPWEMIIDRLKEMEAEEGDAQKIIDHLEKSKLVVALCVRDGFLVVSIGSSVDALEKLGKGDKLIDRPEFKPLAKFADKRLAYVGYTSAVMNEQLADQQQNIANLLNMLDEFLPKTALKDDQKERVRKDAEKLAEDVKSILPKPGAKMGLSFLTDHGVEGYQYAWGDHGDLDSTKPLGLLEHIGGNPLFGLVSRQKTDVAEYDLLIKWVKIGYAYFDEFVMPTIPEPERKKAKKFLDAAIPLAERCDKVNREMLFPALADGQLGLVIDAKLKSGHFMKALPATEKPMPMLEPALVVGVSDPKLLVKAMGQYREIINGMIDAARQIEGSQIPPGIAIPEPTVTETSMGKVYSFALPAELGVDPQIVPNFGLSDKVAVASITRSHTERLLTSTPPAIGGLLAKTDRPIGFALWIHCADLLDAAKPWVDFGVDQATADIDDEDQKKSVSEQVHTGVGLLKVLRNLTSEAYLEDDAIVIHTLAEIHDVEK